MLWHHTAPTEARHSLRLDGSWHHWHLGSYVLVTSDDLSICWLNFLGTGGWWIWNYTHAPLFFQMSLAIHQMSSNVVKTHWSVARWTYSNFWAWSQQLIRMMEVADSWGGPATMPEELPSQAVAKRWCPEPEIQNRHRNLRLPGNPKWLQ